MSRIVCLFIWLALANLTFAERYALILSEPPAAAGAARSSIRAAQTTLRGELARRGIASTGSVERILNAVFVISAPDRVDELRSLPGVQDVVPLRRHYMKLNRAVQLVNAPAAWDALGGVGNAGAGVKIAIIDSGIDQNHPGLRDPSLTPPAGFPRCQGGDCAFTNSKVIVARSYIRAVAAGTPPTPASDSRPDDYSPRDRIGHGTALAMIAAGNTNTGPAATITGMAPKAFVGNYKIFGSADINAGTTSDVIIQALEDALNDGMDIAVLSLGSPALTGPLDHGAACGLGGNTPCDPEAVAVANVISQGLTVVAAAGNEGDLGSQQPTQGTIDAPGYGPTVISVGATTNSHTFVNTLRVQGDAPAALQRVFAEFGDGPLPEGPVTAPLRNVTTLGDDGLGCSGFPRGSLTGVFALIQRGTCTFTQKVSNAQQAGAAGVVLYQQRGIDAIFNPGGLAAISIPVVMIGFSDADRLKSYLEGHPDAVVILDPALTEAQVSVFNEMADFSSRGPSIDGALKPDLVAVGTDMYMAAQTYDPSGPMYDPTGYTVQRGTSFSTPLVAGGVALVKQRNPAFRPAQLRSAVVNTASQDITEGGQPAPIVMRGAGKLDAGAAVASTVTIEPATLSFGVATAVPIQRQLTLTNTGTAPAGLTLSLQPGTRDTLARLTVEPASLTLAPGQSGNVTVTLSGQAPQPGSYEGNLNVQGGTVALHVPYLYVVGDGVAANIFPLFGFDVDGAVNEDNPDGGIAFRVVDRYGVGVAGLPVTFRATRGGGSIFSPERATDSNGVAAAGATFGLQPGSQQFQATAGGLTVTFDATARLKPAIRNDGVVDAATFQPTPIVAGSYITIFGAGLSDVTATAPGARLPISLRGVSVAFDAGNVSVPGNLYYVSPGQVNVQVPWELQGQRSVRVKVDIGRVSGTLASVPIADYAPAVFAYNESANTRLAAALDQNNNVVGTSNPAQRGRTIQVYCNGLGPVVNRPESGEPAPSQSLARTTVPVTATIGGRPAPVGYSGLAPGFSGLYQVNVTVPDDAPTGPQQLVVTVNGNASPPATLPVQ